MKGLQGYQERAGALLKRWKGGSYAFGINCLEKVGDFAAEEGNSTMLVVISWKRKKWIEPFVDEIKSSLEKKGISILDIIPGARPNAPREDVYRIANQIAKRRPESVIAVGGGSTIDAVKAAVVLASLDSDDVETYFGKDLVTERLKAEGRKLYSIIAVQTAASSAAHLTKYSNVTDPLRAQKKLIIDEAIVPRWAVFDYTVTRKVPHALRLDGAMDGIAHCLEVVCGATGKPFFDKTMQIAEVGISLIVEALPRAIDEPEDEKAIESLGLGTDLGGYAIMVGGTNYGHLFSFSLVNKLTHGRACAIANPYVLVFFAPAIEKQLKLIGNIFRKAGYISEDVERYKGRELGVVVAKGMLSFLEKIKFPKSFGEVGVDDEDKRRILNAAKNPQLWSKLEQAPISLIARDSMGKIDRRQTEENIDCYMGSLIDAIISGDFDKIKNMPEA